MKKRILTATIASILLIALVVAFVGCENVSATASNGLSAYELAVKNGYVGTEAQWLESLKQGESAYELAVKNGYVGTEEQWLASLNGEKGKDGKDGKDASYTINDVYEAYKAEYLAENGTEYTGSFIEFLQEYFTQTYETVSTETMVADAVFSCVSVYSNFEVVSYTGNPWSGYRETSETATSAGAGVIYKLDKETGSAYIITNYHVVFNASAKTTISDDIYVLLYGQERVLDTDESGKSTFRYRIPAKYVGGSMKLDVAVLYVENSDILKESDAKAATVGDSTELSIGQAAIAIGNPEAGGISVTSGVISVDSENNRMLAADGSTYVNFRVIRIDTSINGGNSGGGLFDSYGRLIGIVHAKMNSSTAENIAYAIPVNIAVYTADGLIERFEAAGKVGQYAATKCLLGVTVSLTDSYAYYDTETKRVHIVETVTVSENVAETAAAYGKLQKGDVLKKITIVDPASGETRVELDVTRTFVLIDSMLLAREGDVITIDYERNGEAAQAVITVTSTTEIDKIG